MTDAPRLDPAATARTALTTYFALLPSWIVVALPVRLVYTAFARGFGMDQETMIASITSGDLSPYMRGLPMLAISAIVWAALTLPLLDGAREAMHGGATTVRPFLTLQPWRTVGLAAWVWCVWILSIAGAFFLVLPGIYLLMRLSLIAPAAAWSTRNGTPLRDAWRTAHGNMWRIFGMCIVIAVVVFALMIPFTAVRMVAENTWVNVVVETIAWCLSEVFVVALGIAYLQLTERRVIEPAPVVSAPVERSTGAFE